MLIIFTVMLVLLLLLHVLLAIHVNATHFHLLQVHGVFVLLFAFFEHLHLVIVLLVSALHLFLLHSRLFVYESLLVSLFHRLSTLFSWSWVPSLALLPVREWLNFAFLTELSVSFFALVHVSQTGYALSLIKSFLLKPLVHRLNTLFKFLFLCLSDMQQFLAHLVLRLSNQLALESLLSILLLKPVGVWHLRSLLLVVIVFSHIAFWIFFHLSVFRSQFVKEDFWHLRYLVIHLAVLLFLVGAIVVLVLCVGMVVYVVFSRWDVLIHQLIHMIVSFFIRFM